VCITSKVREASLNLMCHWFLADHTSGRAFGTLCRLSVVCLSVTFCTVVKCYILAKNCLKEQIGTRVKKMIFWVAAIFLLPVLPLRPPRRPFLPYFCPYSPVIGTRLCMDFLAANHLRIVGLCGQN